MTDLHTKAQSMTKPEAERELVRLWELEESLKPRGMDSAPKDGTWVFLIFKDRPLPEMGFWGQKFSTYGAPLGERWGFGTGWDMGFRDEPVKWLPIPKFNLEGEK